MEKWIVKIKKNLYLQQFLDQIKTNLKFINKCYCKVLCEFDSYLLEP